MAEFFKLYNQIKHYEWGSPDYIPRLLGLAGKGSPFVDGEPWAELWMGSHPASPSLVSLPPDETSLGDLIARDPRRYLGEKAAERYGALPFLFKLLAAEKPLSIQAHPNPAQAREGFDRENKAGLAPDAPNRSYRDSNHKPEIICALTPFTGMCGFREPEEIQNLISNFFTQRHGDTEGGALAAREALSSVTSCLYEGSSENKLKNFLKSLFGLSLSERQALTEYILSCKPASSPGASAPLREVMGTDSPIEWELMRNFARLYPGDPAVIAPIYLNVFRLEPGEAIFLGAGVPHAYIHGFGVELMANSDNVLRGGLTSKYIDVPELMKVLDFNPLKLKIIRPEPGFSYFCYPSPCEEFSLAVMRGTGGAAAFAPQSPSICIVTEGKVSVGENGVILTQGESAFFPPIANGAPLMLRGNYTLYIASLPQPGHIPASLWAGA